MLIESMSIQSLQIPFKVSFSHASADRNQTQSVLVSATSKDGQTGYGEGCPREYVTGESLASVFEFFHAHQDEVSELSDLSGLQNWVVDHRQVIDANPAAWCAMELALLDLLGKSSQQSLETLLGMQELQGTFQYSAILGTANPKVFEKVLRMYREMGFTDFKVKLMGDRIVDQRNISLVNTYLDNTCRIRFDANNLWQDADSAASYLSSLDRPFWAVEEPLTTEQYAELTKLATSLGVKIILDESFLRLNQIDLLDNNAECWLINVRISKMGGFLRSIEIVNACRQRGIRVIIGAQVGETSLLTRAALTVANNAGDILIAQEGAFGSYLLEKDIGEPSLMFRQGGRLDIDNSSLQKGFGNGIEVSECR